MNYKEESVTGATYTRASGVTISNRLNGYKGISFQEETVTTLSNGSILNVPSGAVDEEFSVENMHNEFPLLDAEGVPTGSKATYADVYTLLFSLYYFVADKRDKAQVKKEADEKLLEEQIAENTRKIEAANG